MKNLVCSVCDEPSVSVTFRVGNAYAWCKSCGHRVTFRRFLSADSMAVEILNNSAPPNKRVQADVLSCGHSQGIVFGENSWSCAVCGAIVRG